MTKLRIPYIYYLDEVDDQGVSMTLPNFTKDISEDGLMITNTLIVGTLTITKVNGLDPTLVLAGGGFELQRADDTIVQDTEGNDLRGTTDPDGEISWSNIPYGTYKLVETEVPDGFNLFNKDIKIVIDADHIFLETSVIMKAM